MLMIGKRSMNKFISGLLKKDNYISILNGFKVYNDIPNSIFRYLFNIGNYPYKIKVNTSLGIIEPTLYSYHDMITVHIIFCRGDYIVGNDIRVVVDIGSNIGISTLYFLTRNSAVKCYLFEPVPQNLERLKKNLLAFKDRYILNEAAVYDRGGTVDFGVEETGVYGGIDRSTGKFIKVQCVDINNVLEKIIQEENVIDILKIDTEGAENQTMMAIEDKYFAKIRCIYAETKPNGSIYTKFGKYYDIKYYDVSSVCQLRLLR